MTYFRLTRQGQIRRLRTLAAHALAAYGIEPESLALLAHLYNTTCTVTDPEGSRYVLHILRPDCTVPEAQGRVRAESELWWLDTLRADLGLSLPAVVRTP